MKQQISPAVHWSTASYGALNRMTRRQETKDYRKWIVWIRMNGNEMKVKLKLPHLAFVRRSVHFLGHFYLTHVCMNVCALHGTDGHMEDEDWVMQQKSEQKRASFLEIANSCARTTATKKYCSSNANFIELFGVPFKLSRFDGSRFIGNTVFCVCLCVFICRLIYKCTTSTIYLWLLLHVGRLQLFVCLFVFGSFQRRLS